MMTWSVSRLFVAGASMLLGLVGLLSAAGGHGPRQQRVTDSAVVDTTGAVARPIPSADDGGSDSMLDIPGFAAPRLDLQGDEVSPALAAYGIDRDGNLFEVHSPQTELPRLPQPKS